MLIRTVSADAPELEVLEEAARLLRAGGLVGLPTETVYGLAAHALDEAAVRRIFAAKGRPGYNPLIVHVADAAAARALAGAWPERAARLAARFWPGPLTLVVPKTSAVPDVVTAGLGTVALRVPAHPVALGVIRAAGLPVAAPSANRFTELSPTTAAHVAAAFGDRVDLILDAGPARVGIESTVVDLSGARSVLLRPGTLTRAALEAEAGPLDDPPPPLSATAPRPAPGMVERHYAPRARVRLFDDAGRVEAEAEARDSAAAGAAAGGVLLGRFGAPLAHAVAMPAEPDAYAARLYAALHELDALGCDVVFVERPPPGAAWAGVADRLRRAGR